MKTVTKEEAKELEDDRVNFDYKENYQTGLDINGLCVELKAINGHCFRASEDGLTVTLHKKEVK